MTLRIRIYIVIAIFIVYSACLLTVAGANTQPLTSEPQSCFRLDDTSCLGSVIQITDPSNPIAPRQVTCYRIVKIGTGQYRLDVKLRNDVPGKYLEFRSGFGCKDRIKFTTDTVNATYIDDRFYDDSGNDVSGSTYTVQWGSALFSIPNETQPVELWFTVDWSLSQDTTMWGKQLINLVKRTGEIHFQPDTSVLGLPRVISHNNFHDCQVCGLFTPGCGGLCTTTGFPIAP